MSAFYTVYKISTSLPGAEEYTNTYEIFDSQESFLKALKFYVQHAKECKLQMDDEHLEAFPDEQEEYEGYLALIEERLENPTSTNRLYRASFEAFDVGIEILVASNNFINLYNTLLEDLLERNYLDDISEVWDMEPDERREIFEENPLIRYYAMIQASGRKPSEKTFVTKFKNSEYDINYSAFSLRI